MTPKEKAKELVNKLTLSSNAQDGSWMCEDLAKQCALIAAENTRTEMVQLQNYDRAIYWRDVKSQIKML